MVKECSERVCSCYSQVCKICGQPSLKSICKDCLDSVEDVGKKICWRCLRAVNSVYKVLVPPRGKFESITSGDCSYDGCRKVRVELDDMRYCKKHYEPVMESVCLECHDDLPKYCSNCMKAESMLIGTLCVTCHHGNTWKDPGQGSSRLNTCKTCGNRRVLNMENDCFDCHVNTRVKNDDKLRSCPSCKKTVLKRYSKCPYCYSALTRVCRNCFGHVKYGQNICEKCQYTCEGCHDKFEQEDKCQIHCKTCLGKMEAERCLNCDINARLDAMGYCSTCSLKGMPRNNYRCKSCKESIVSNPSRPCMFCKKNFVDCIQCSKVHPQYEYDCGNH